MNKGYKEAKAEIAARKTEGPHKYLTDVKDTFYRAEEEL